ncbi:MAG: hypothetical protein NTV46_11405 [Verrucomicrobia bacterium]|nr:hypothetical protein [Verrucomicrobiota bacterium]
MSAANAGYSTTRGNYSGNTYSSYGSTSSYGTYSSSTYNYAAANAAQNAASDRARSNAEQMAAQNNGNLNYLSSVILKRETVFPGKNYSGMIHFDTPPLADTGTIRFRVRVGGEVHVLEFDVIKK